MLCFLTGIFRSYRHNFLFPLLPHKKQLVYLRPQQKNDRAEIYPQHNQADCRQTAVDYRSVREIGDIQRIKERKQYPSNGSKDSPGQV